MPRTTISTGSLYWVYVLQSKQDGKMYVGFTTNIKNRLLEHQQGKSASTAPRRPIQLIYLEACTNRADALRREQYFKKTGGKIYLSKRLKEFFMSNKLKL